MSISAMSVSGLIPSTTALQRPNLAVSGGGRGGGGVMTGFGKSGLVVECSSRPQKKGTAHHKKTRPKKTQPWDIRRGPATYPPLPALPPDWILVAAGQIEEEEGGGEGEVKEVDVEVIPSS